VSLRRVAVLCAAGESYYHHIRGVVVYDKATDARNFPGGMPVIAHPPCRAWSQSCSQLANPSPGEKELGIWCAEQVKTWGGILEQPARSKLWDVCGLPKPDFACRADIWAAEVWQAWWGYSMMKRTWLLFVGIAPSEVQFPFQLHAKGADKRRFQLMSQTERSRTVPFLAKWLVANARKTKGGAA